MPNMGELSCAAKHRRPTSRANTHDGRHAAGFDSFGPENAFPTLLKMLLIPFCSYDILQQTRE